MVITVSFYIHIYVIMRRMIPNKSLINPLVIGTNTQIHHTI